MPPQKKDLTEQDIKDVTRIAKMRLGPAKVEKIGLFDKQRTIVKGFNGPVPDVIGYTQHITECASDAIQEILMFSDGLREYTQPIVYGLTREQVDLRSKLSLPYAEWKRYTDYFTFLQKRFRTHYDVLNVLLSRGIKPQEYHEEFDRICELDPIFGQKQRHSPQAGILALKRLKEEIVYTQSGMSDEEIQQTYTTLLKWLGVPYTVVGRTQAAVNKNKLVAIELVGVINVVHSDKKFRMPKIAHATGFLKMENEWYHYDNEVGLMKSGFGVIEALLDRKMIYVDIGRKRYFCRIEDTYSISRLTDYPIVKAVWKNGAWDKDVSEVVDATNTLRRGASVFLPRYQSVFAIMKSVDSVPYNVQSDCVSIKQPKTLEEFTNTMSTFRDCIHSNQTSNSRIFENMYHYAFDNFEYLKASPEFFKMIVISIDSVITRTACTPMIHYWCFNLKRLIRDLKLEYKNWFEISNNLPRLRRPIVIRKGDVGTPTSASPLTPTDENIEVIYMDDDTTARDLKRMNEAERKRIDEAERLKMLEGQKERLSPCPKGMVRDRKTRRCREKTEESIHRNATRKEERKKAKNAAKNGAKNKTKKAKKEPKVYVF